MLQLGEIDRTDPRPPYQQIAAMLRSAIDSGALEPGAKLPSEATLTGHFGVARMTVRQAVQELRGEGLVIAEHGRGVFVRPLPPDRQHFEPGRWWLVLGPDGEHWCETSNEAEAREAVRPGDTLYRLYRMVVEEWRQVAP